MGFGRGDGLMECCRCGKKPTKNVALFSVNNLLPSQGRKYACWECMTVSERKRHMLNIERKDDDR